MSNTMFGGFIGICIILCLVEHWLYKRRRARKIKEMEARWKQFEDNHGPVGAYRPEGSVSGRWSSKDLAKPGSERTSMVQMDMAKLEQKVVANLTPEETKAMTEYKPKPHRHVYEEDCCSCDDPSH